MDVGKVEGQSSEVWDQRLRDLVEYLRGSLPTLFAPDDDTAVVSGREMMAVLSELEDEFALGSKNSFQMLLGVGWRIEAIMDPVIDSKMEVFMKRLEFADPEYSGVDGSVVVDWLSVAPLFDGNLGALRDMSGMMVTALLNYTMWINPDWLSMFTSLSLNLPQVTEYLMGMTGFLLLFIYIQIVEEGKYPEVRFVPADSSPDEII